jgi:hypothetical protein
MKLIYHDDERLVVEIVSGAWWHHAIRAGIYMTTVSVISYSLVTKILAYKCYSLLGSHGIRLEFRLPQVDHVGLLE